MTDELDGATAIDLARRIRDRAISPVELLDRVIARIERRNPSLNAMVIFGFDEARAQARRAEAAVMRGERLGPLHGLPVAMKDCFDFKPGWVSSFGGVRALRDYRTSAACPFVERMEAAGAIVIGKTNSPIFGFRGTCDNYAFGPSRNPFNLAKNTGGSSGGSAAMVADGLLPIAEGTDGGGSIRIPAAWCGVYGYKPAFGRVPMRTRPNAFGGTAPFLFEGAITRTVADAALAVSALAGYDSRDPFSLDTGLDPLAALNGSVRGWKIGYSRDFGMYPVDPEVLRVTDQAVAALAAAGAQVEEVRIDMRHSQQELSDVWCRLVLQGLPLTLEGFRRDGIDLLRDHPQDLPPELHHWLRVIETRSAVDYLGDQVKRSDVFEAVGRVLDDCRMLVTPTLACLPVDNATDGNTVGPRAINGETVDPLIGWCMTYPVNFTGHPAASVPAGLSADGLPVGLQLIGRRYADADVLAASAAIERERPWQASYARCAARPLDVH
ncbi:MAG: amidase [Alphaproteobacteria bacterium]|nr:amidase [Alphaproteobacteria bacterium]